MPPTRVPTDGTLAAAACRHLGIGDDIVQLAIDSFVNDAHRLEFIESVDGVSYINDSKATNVDSVFWALDAMRERVVWIAGGQDKGNDYSVLDPLVREKVRALVAMGADNTKLLDHFGGMVPVFDTHGIDEAVLVSSENAEAGDVVLLSPACASFDLFRNYMHRGEEFRRVVMKLKTRSAV